MRSSPVSWGGVGGGTDFLRQGTARPHPLVMWQVICPAARVLDMWPPAEASTVNINIILYRYTCIYYIHKCCITYMLYNIFAGQYVMGEAHNNKIELFLFDGNDLHFTRKFSSLRYAAIFFCHRAGTSWHGCMILEEPLKQLNISQYCIWCQLSFNIIYTYDRCCKTPCKAEHVEWVMDVSMYRIMSLQHSLRHVL